MTVDRELFSKESVGKLLFKFSYPAVIGMVALGFYNISDAIFVGYYAGKEALAAITIILPVIMLIMAISNVIGVGASAIWSVDIGTLHYNRASKVFGNAITLTLIFSALLITMSFLFLDEILRFLSTPTEIYVLAKTYLGILLAGSFFLIFTRSINNFIRAEGSPFLAMSIALIAALGNILLDILFIVFLNLGVMGAAWATVLSHLASSICIFIYLFSGKSKIKVFKENLTLDYPIIKEIANVGMASFLRQISVGIKQYMLNISVVWYAGGESALYLAIVGIALRLTLFSIMPSRGIFMGLQPIIGFNYGAALYKRVSDAIQNADRYATALTIVIWGVLLLFTSQFLSLFTKDPLFVEKGTFIVQVILVALPFIAVQIIASGVFQSLKKPLPANILAITRHCIFLVPFILLLPMYWGLWGVWFAVPLADFTSFLLTRFMLDKQLKHLLCLEQSKACDVSYVELG